MSPPPLRYLALAGPTASGKSSAAARLAAAISGEVVCADAFQLLAGLPILTAQPDATDLATAPHHLYGAIPLGTPMDAGRFAALASPVITDILARGHTPIVTVCCGLMAASAAYRGTPVEAADEWHDAPVAQHNLMLFRATAEEVAVM